jgi:hypothetical protein
MTNGPHKVSAAMAAFVSASLVGNEIAHAGLLPHLENQIPGVPAGQRAVVITTSSSSDMSSAAAARFLAQLRR